MKDFGPFLIFAFIFAIPITAIIVSYFMRKLQSQERLRAIEKGLPLDPPEWTRPDPWQHAADLRLAGLILVGVGLGLVAVFVGLSWSVPQFPKGVSASAAIPFLIGAALLYEYRTRRRELGPRPVPPVSQPSRPI